MNKRKKHLLCLALGGSLLFGASQPAAAEEVEEFSMEEYVVTASRMPTKRTETAANVTVVSREEIERKNMTTVAEALTEAGVQVSLEGGSAGDNAAVILNGDKRVVILVDGRKLNQDQRTDNSSLGYSLSMLPDLNSIEKIEVVRGAASALYGSEGVGGVINVITRKGSEEKTVASSEFGSWSSRQYSLHSSGKTGNTGYVLSAKKSSQDHYEYKNPFTGKVSAMPNSEFERETVAVRIDTEFDEKRSLAFTFDHLREDVGAPNAAPYVPAYFRPDGKRWITQNNVSLAYRWKQGDSITNNLQVYRNHQKMLWFNASGYNEMSRYLSETDGVEWNQVRKLGDHTAIVGFDWRDSYSDNVLYNYKNHKLRNLGLFIEDSWNWNPAWTFTAGIRKDDPSEYSGETTARLGLNRKINDYTNAYLSWGEVFRGPDAVALFMPETPNYKPNPDLKPETGYSTTMGFNTRLSSGTNIQTSIFSSHTKNAFKWWYAPDYSYAKIINVGKQKKRGMDIAITHPLTPQWDLTAGYAYLKVEENEGAGYNLDPGNSNPNYYRLGVAYHQDGWNVNIAGRGATGRSKDGFTSKQYWLLDAAVSYQLNPNVKVYAKGYNLTNRAYETTYLYNIIGAQPMASRQLVFGVEGRL